MIYIQALQEEAEYIISELNSKFSIIFIDVDFLIRYRMRFGDKVCDKIMKNITAFLKKEYADCILIHKNGCDEFIVILIDYDLISAEKRAYDTLKEFRKNRFLTFMEGGLKKLKMTFSAGIAASPENGEKKEILKKSLTAMQTAKALRRNNVYTYPINPEIHKNRIIFNSNLKVSDYFGKWGVSGCVDNCTERFNGLLWEPQAICTDDSGNLYIADQNNHRIIKVNDCYASIVIKGLNKPTGICVKNKKLYITDTGNDIVLKHDLVKDKTHIICGTGKAGYEGDGGKAVNALLNKPGGICLDKFDNIYINDIANNIIRKIDKNGYISTYAGNGKFGFFGDGGKAENACFNEIYAICIDTSGMIMYIADYFNSRIRRINILTGLIDTIAGNGSDGYSGDGGLSKQASLSRPTAVCTDLNGNLYIANSHSHCVRIVENQTGKIYTLAGGLGIGISDNENINTFKFSNPNSLAVYKNILYISDGAGNRICKIKLSEEMKRNEFTN